MIADNGTEFSKHQQNAKAQEMAIFFADHITHGKGAVKNTKGLISQSFLKGTDFDKYINMV